MTFTAFCQDVSGEGTIWISTLDASTVKEAIEEAREACAADWECASEQVHVLGLAEGSVKIAHWQDLCE